MTSKPAQDSALHSRRFYLSWAVGVLALGWSARANSPLLPAFLGAYAPDTLWALLVFLLVAAAKPRLPTTYTVLTALAFAYGVEMSQLYQAPWISAVRATRLGGLVLGHGFLWSDLACYSVGIGLGGLLARWQGARRRGDSPRPQRNRHASIRKQSR